MTLPVSNHQQKHLSNQPRPTAKKIISYSLPHAITMSPDSNPESQNEKNYQAWKNEHEQRKRELRTQFNIWRYRQSERMCNHQLFKSESEEQSEQLKEIIEKRLSNACSCNTCRAQEHEVTNTLGSTNDLVATQIPMPNTPS